jgi:hypothetical protein
LFSHTPSLEQIDVWDWFWRRGPISGHSRERACNFISDYQRLTRNRFEFFSLICPFSFFLFLCFFFPRVRNSCTLLQVPLGELVDHGTRSAWVCVKTGALGGYLRSGAGGGKGRNESRTIGHTRGRGRVSVRSIATHRLGDNGGQAGRMGYPACHNKVACLQIYDKFAQIHRQQ